jgi:RNA polymerase sigma-70 factor (ECF subfamily)
MGEARPQSNGAGFKGANLGESETPLTEVLVGAAQAGDRGALETLFTRYLPRVRHMVALRLGYTVGGLLYFEDVVQEALLNVFQNLDRFEQRSEARFCNWISVCVANTVKEQLRRGRAKKRIPTLPFAPFSQQNLTEGILAGDEESPPLLAEGVEFAERIEKCLLDMREEHREIIILCRICGMSHEEVAKTLGLPSPAAARKLLSRALRCLREELDT